MKNIEEQQCEAAMEHAKKMKSGTRIEACISFGSGVDWERNRNKWINVKDEKPKFNKNVNALTSKNRFVLSFIDGSGQFDLHECDQFEDEKGEYEHIVAWQYAPEPPKKEENHED